MISVIIFLLLILSKFYNTSETEINFLTYSLDNDNYLEELTNDFNNYAQEKELDIHVNRILISTYKDSTSLSNYNELVEYILQKNSTKYDVFMMSSFYTYKYQGLTSDLRNYISSDVIDNYMNKHVKNLGYFNDKLIGLPLYIETSLLYSNKEYLDKYNQTIPKTWDQLIETASYILEKEKEKGNEDLLGYLGYFPYSDVSVSSMLEFIYGFRSNVENEDIPQYGSMDSVDSFNKLREIKEKVSSDENFKLDDKMIIPLLNTNNVLFARYWNINTPLYYISPLPGKEEGISSSFMNGYYLMISNGLSEEKKKASGKLIEFLLSKDIQKKFIKNFKYSGYNNIYNENSDDELCSENKCELFKSLQLINNQTKYISNFDKKMVKMLNFIDDFLYNKEDTVEILDGIDKLVNIHDIRYKSIFGTTTIIVMGVLMLIIFLSYILILFDRFSFYLDILDKVLWFILIQGLCLTFSYGYYMMGIIRQWKCNAGVVSFQIGISLFFYPILVKEIINFPECNRFTVFVKKHKYLFIVILLSFDSIFAALIFIISPFEIQTVKVSNGSDFNVCSITNPVYLLSYALYFGYKVIIYLCLGLLAFMEWNMDGIYKETRLFTTVHYVNSILFIIYLITKIIPIKNMNAHLLMKIGMPAVFSLANYIILIWMYMYKEISRYKHNESVKIMKADKTTDNTISGSGKQVRMKSKIMQYHFNRSNSSPAITATTLSSSTKGSKNTKEMKDIKEMEGIKEEQEVIINFNGIPEEDD
ncbi:periplasmic binding protein-like II [Anaeromyces robustus]|uniref:Periplasmic binding protein-like II n=1 Tax=Anaeromyces robustus TaxID=1754192 RepID=A0A1Y1VMU3_9FUNG|nr:periplasmic binding protein-like II [Anaeromyces robustus]|eukprot:ORX60234.1 periplasmic binding protein-like II [Anaeromyces robustus]